MLEKLSEQCKELPPFSAVERNFCLSSVSNTEFKKIHSNRRFRGSVYSFAPNVYFLLPMDTIHPGSEGVKGMREDRFDSSHVAETFSL